MKNYRMQKNSNKILIFPCSILLFLIIALISTLNSYATGSNDDAGKVVEVQGALQWTKTDIKIKKGGE